MYIDTFTSLCRIFDQVSQGSKVLEIGCGSGKLSNLLRIWKHCKVYCIDKDPICSSFAKGKCIEVLNIDIENSELPYKDGYFDYIILVNVLEHMIYPDKVLIDLKRYLSENGSLIYSVPNIVNWHSRMTILSGKFEYTDGTVFDRNHLRFFNFISAKNLAIDAGYRIVWIDVTPSVYFYGKKLNFLWYQLAKAWKNLFADEFLIQAKKQN